MKVNIEFVDATIEVLESEIAQIENGIYMSKKLRAKIDKELKEIKKLRAQYGKYGLSTKYLSRAVPDLKDTLEQRQAIIKNLKGYLNEKKEMLKVFKAAK